MFVSRLNIFIFFGKMAQQLRVPPALAEDQPLHGGSQLCLPLVLVGQMLFSSLQGHQKCMWCRYIHASKHSHIQKKHKYTLIFFFYISLFSLWVWEHIEVRGLLVGVNSVPPPRVAWGGTQVIRLGDMHLYPLAISPALSF